MIERGRAVVSAACAVLVLSAAARPPLGARVGLTGLSSLKPAYDAVLNAQFERARQVLAEACGPAPREACEVLQATSLWWQIVLDPRNTGRDAAFLATVERAIADAERWVEREPERAEAWFYLGAAYGARVSWRVERGHRLSAARDGKRIKDALEQALEIEPTLDDARFGIGLYKYYADIAPTAGKILRVLLLLPGGDKDEGLRDMQATEAAGQLVSGEALYQLHWIYLWYEHDPVRGLDALERLHARYPANPHFLQRIAEVQVQYFHDAARSLAAWQRLVDTADRSGDPELAEVRGRIGRAEQLAALDETDRALPDLRRVIALAPSRPAGAVARAQLLLGRTLDRLGDRSAAVVAYRAALSSPVPEGDPDEVRSAARAGLSQTPDREIAAGHRTGLEGWRAFERGELDAATTLLTRARQLAPNDALVRARLARVTATRHPQLALSEFDAIIASRPAVSPLALGAAYLWSGELLERRGRAAQAADRFRAAGRVHAGDSRITDAADAALAKMGIN